MEENLYLLTDREMDIILVCLFKAIARGQLFHWGVNPEYKALYEKLSTLTKKEVLYAR